MEMELAKEVTENERAAVEAALVEKFGGEPLSSDAGGNSPYSPVGVIYGPVGADEHGTRVAISPVCRSHDGAGHYKERGRWRTVYVVAPKEGGEWAVCSAGDRDAIQLGVTGFYIRPWESHEAEQTSGGMGLGAVALAEALDAVGL